MSDQTTKAAPKTKTEAPPINPNYPDLSRLLSSDRKKNTRWLWFFSVIAVVGFLTCGIGIQIGEIASSGIGLAFTTFSVFLIYYFARNRKMINEAITELSQPGLNIVLPATLETVPAETAAETAAEATADEEKK